MPAVEFIGPAASARRIRHPGPCGRAVSVMVMGQCVTAGQRVGSGLPRRPRFGHDQCADGTVESHGSTTCPAVFGRRETGDPNSAVVKVVCSDLVTPAVNRRDSPVRQRAGSGDTGSARRGGSGHEAHGCGNGRPGAADSDDGIGVVRGLAALVSREQAVQFVIARVLPSAVFRTRGAAATSTVPRWVSRTGHPGRRRIRCLGSDPVCLCRGRRQTAAFVGAMYNVGQRG